MVVTSATAAGHINGKLEEYAGWAGKGLSTRVLPPRDRLGASSGWSNSVMPIVVDENAWMTRPYAGRPNCMGT